MPKLNPNDSPPDEMVPAGVYLLGWTWFKRKRGGTSGKEYLSVKFDVIHGNQKGNGFFTAMSLDLSKSGAVRRWQILCEVFGITEEFELGSEDEGTADEGDENIRKLFVGRAFKAQVGVSRNGNYTNNEVKSLSYPRQYTDEDKQIIEAWEKKQREKADDFGPPPEDDAPAGDEWSDAHYDSFDDEEVGF